MTAWKKLGQVCGGAGASWAASHAALPVVDALPDGRHRVYFSARDDRGRARIGFADTDLIPGGSWRVSGVPAIDLGPLGSFSDNGVTSASLVTHGGVKYQFFTGWSLGVTVPFYLSAGLAISEDGGAS